MSVKDIGGEWHLPNGPAKTIGVADLFTGEHPRHLIYYIEKS